MPDYTKSPAAQAAAAETAMSPQSAAAPGQSAAAAPKPTLTHAAGAPSSADSQVVPCRGLSRVQAWWQAAQQQAYDWGLQLNPSPNSRSAAATALSEGNTVIHNFHMRATWHERMPALMLAGP